MTFDRTWKPKGFRGDISLADEMAVSSWRRVRPTERKISTAVTVMRHLKIMHPQRDTVYTSAIHIYLILYLLRNTEVVL